MSFWFFILKKNKIQASVKAMTGPSLRIMRAGVLVSHLVYEFAPHNKSGMKGEVKRRVIPPRDEVSI
jgi:hypothetical protein